MISMDITVFNLQKEGINKPQTGESDDNIGLFFYGGSIKGCCESLKKAAEMAMLEHGCTKN